MALRDIRLSPSSYAVMALLRAAGGEATPYELKQLLEKSVENFWPVPHTTFYAEPARLAAGGFLSERQESGGRRRKLYALTDKGREALEAWTHSEPAAAPVLRDEGVLKIFAGGDLLPIFNERCVWHRAKLAELEGYLEAVPTEPHWEGVRASLFVGVRYHRMLLDAMEGLLRSQQAQAAEPQAATGSS